MVFGTAARSLEVEVVAVAVAQQDPPRSAQVRILVCLYEIWNEVTSLEMEVVVVVVVVAVAQKAPPPWAEVRFVDVIETVLLLLERVWLELYQGAGSVAAELPE